MSKKPCKNCNDSGVSIAVKCPCCNNGEGPSLALVNAAPAMLAGLKLAVMVMKKTQYQIDHSETITLLEQAIEKARG